MVGIDWNKIRVKIKNWNNLKEIEKIKIKIPQLPDCKECGIKILRGTLCNKCVFKKDVENCKECNTSPKCRGFCINHYNRFSRLRGFGKVSVCKVCGKEKPNYAKGKCKKCYMRILRKC